MLQKNLTDHLQKNFRFLSNKKLLVAVSGGIDSMVLLDVFYNLGYEIHVAHCNFQLRGEDALLDKLLVQKRCNELKIPFHSIDFETEKIARQKKKSIQLIARKLRYDWFYELIEKENLDYVLTAHHLDDSIETFFINLSRGTGLRGLMGIPATNNKIIRPFLKFTKEELKIYATQKKLEWREDASNQKIDYTRNKIRHQISPNLVSLHPSFYANFMQTQNILSENQEIIEGFMAKIKKEVMTKNENEISISIPKILNKKPLNSVLFAVFSPFGLNSLEEISKLLQSETGSIRQTNTHVLLKNREEILAKKLTKTKNDEKYLVSIEKDEFSIEKPIKLQFKISEIQENNNYISLDFNKIQFPLTIRKWQAGDFFYPLGIKGKQKVSKFFKDKKLSIFEKSETWLMCDETGSILWIIGYRMDNRYKITEKTKNILNIKFFYK